MSCLRFINVHHTISALAALLISLSSQWVFFPHQHLQPPAPADYQNQLSIKPNPLSRTLQCQTYLMHKILQNTADLSAHPYIKSHPKLLLWLYSLVRSLQLQRSISETLGPSWDLGVIKLHTLSQIRSKVWSFGGPTCTRLDGGSGSTRQDKNDRNINGENHQHSPTQERQNDDKTRQKYTNHLEILVYWLIQPLLRSHLRTLHLLPELLLRSQTPRQFRPFGVALAVALAALQALRTTVHLTGSHQFVELELRQVLAHGLPGDKQHKKLPSPHSPRPTLSQSSVSHSRFLRSIHCAAGMSSLWKAQWTHCLSLPAFESTFGSALLHPQRNPGLTSLWRFHDSCSFVPWQRKALWWKVRVIKSYVYCMLNKNPSCREHILQISRTQEWLVIIPFVKEFTKKQVLVRDGSHKHGVL